MRFKERYAHRILIWPHHLFLFQELYDSVFSVKFPEGSHGVFNFILYSSLS